MNERLSKQKKYMSSKDLYFLPSIKHMIMPKNKYFSSQRRTSPIKSRTIQEIIQKYTSLTAKPQIHQESILPNLQEIDNNNNLYNKYEMLPKIYKKKNKISSQNLQEMVKITHRKKEGIPSSPTKKQNIDQLNLYDRNHFNKRLTQQADKFQFQLNYKFSEKQFFNNSIAEENQQIACVVKKKYTKIITQDKQNIEQIKKLQKVPDFLLKILDKRKSILHFQ